MQTHFDSLSYFQNSWFSTQTAGDAFFLCFYKNCYFARESQGMEWFYQRPRNNFEVLIWARWFKAINMRWNVDRSMGKWARQRYCAVPNPMYSFFPVFWHFLVKSSNIWGFTHFWWELRVLKIIRRIKVRLHSKTFKDSKKKVFVATGNFWENLRKIMLRYQREAS